MNLYVGNLPWSATEEELKTHFEEAGPVKAVRIITEGRTGRSKGFAFVEMESEGDGQTAIDSLNGKDFGGRELRVDKATERS